MDYISSIYSTPERVVFEIFAYITAASMRSGLVKQWADLRDIFLRFIGLTTQNMPKLPIFYGEKHVFSIYSTPEGRLSSKFLHI